ncbi:MULTISPECIES: hypothetical protein [unclassified Microbacterium]|uniref:iron chaperone n=1 Tax=unclassified Microbacterium TaxID=2609290 RepID=UPI00214C2675|nr:MULTISPECIES: hypothetical protein [unclassified Microbacterium]MCR2783113.1 hypothetical protein [Microbacterium sp. zg.B96]MDL5352102.1 hypothetical protein [Microbacterium sp. zg-YB36]WIM16004.1 hypothetical protein QNO11_15985 [Microbacterium sp. zg-B96]
MADTRTSTDSTFSADERAAMKQRAEELKAQAGNGKGAAKKQKEAQACLDAIAALPEPDKTIAERFHAAVTETAPGLDPKTWYGFPSYAKDGKVLTFFQPASKFDTRYANIGFNEVAALDDGEFWPTAFAVLEYTDAVDETVRKLVKKAVG